MGIKFGSPLSDKFLFPPMTSSLSLSLEPPRLFAGDGLDDDLFARPARLQDLNLEDGREVLTR